MKYFIIFFICGVFMHNIYAHTYDYTYGQTGHLPKAININDTKKIDEYYQYFMEDFNIKSKSSNGYIVYKPVLFAKMEVVQWDKFNLNAKIEIQNNQDFDWFIPRYDERSIYSEKKIYLIKDKSILETYPSHNFYRKLVSKDGVVVNMHEPIIENVSFFAYFKKNSKYILNYDIAIPSDQGETFTFDIFFRENTYPVEIIRKYSRERNADFPELETESNTIKVSCQAIDGKVENGFHCTFKY